VGPFHALGRAARARAGAGCSPADGRAEQDEITDPGSSAGAGRRGRRLKQRLARGTESLDDRIDLHGKTQSEAHAALLSFLRMAQSHGAKFVLVITGKGGGARDDWDERGVLKRQVPQWLKLPEFRGYVVGFEDAHSGHGGAGALYVRIRRPKSGTRRHP
jgi:DNA-nicking Smr family endonuclease